MNIEIDKRLAAGLIVVASIFFPVFWYQELGPAPLNAKAIAVIALYIVATAGLVAVALGKLGPQLTSEVTDRKVQEAMSAFTSKYALLALGLLLLWSCYSIWSILNAT